MASLTLNLSIGDIFTPVKDAVRTIASRENRQNYIHAFDMFALRAIIVMILLSSMVLVIMCTPHVITIIQSLLESFRHLSRNVSVRHTPTSMTSFVQFTTLLPLLFLLMD